MLWIPGKGEPRHESNLGSTGSSTLGTTVTTGGTAATKGAVVELVASTAFDAHLIQITATNYASATAASDGAMDIMIGAATEDIVIPDMLFGGAGVATGANIPAFKSWLFPLYIPAGSRLSCQAAGARTTTGFEVAVHLWGWSSPPFRVGSRVLTYGMGTVPNGTAITPGASGAQGAWAQVTASTSADHFYLFPSFQVTNDTTQNLRNYNVGIGMGAATEELIGDKFVYHTSTNESMGGPERNIGVFKDIPSGTRLVMRASNSGVNDAGYDGVIHAVVG